MNTTKLAIVAATEDASAVDTLALHLTTLRRRGCFVIAPPDEAAALLVILSARLVANDQLMAQIEAAQARGACVVPIRYSACEIPEALRPLWALGPREGAVAGESWIATATGGRVDELWASVVAPIHRMLLKLAPAATRT